MQIPASYYNTIFGPIQESETQSGKKNYVEAQITMTKFINFLNSSYSFTFSNILFKGADVIYFDTRFFYVNRTNMIYLLHATETKMIIEFMTLEILQVLETIISIT